MELNNRETILSVENLHFSYSKSKAEVLRGVNCEIKRGETLLVDGYTIHVCLDYKQLRPVRPPEWFVNLLT